MRGIRIRPWAQGDAALLAQGNSPGMTTHLGGPETDSELAARHARYLRLWRDGGARMFAITASDGGRDLTSVDDVVATSDTATGTDTAIRPDIAVGAIGWWSTRWRDEEVAETGWFVVPEAQGHGVAGAAVRLIIEDAVAYGSNRLLVAFPSVANPSSNRLCERTGFVLDGQEDFPFRGAVLRVNAWVLDLDARRSKRSDMDTS